MIPQITITLDIFAVLFQAINYGGIGHFVWAIEDL